MLDIRVHHFYESCQRNYGMRNKFLVRDVEGHLRSVKENWTDEIIENAIFSQSTRCRRCWNISNLLEWPREHSQFLLAYSSQLGYQGFHIVSSRTNKTKVTLGNLELEFIPKGLSVGLWEWLDTISPCALLRRHAAVEELCQIKPEAMNRAYDAPYREMQDAYYQVFRLYYLNEQNPEQRETALTRVRDMLEHGLINQRCGGVQEERIHTLATPLYHLVEAIWRDDHSAIEAAIIKAMEDNYHYFAYVYPSPGDKTGPASHGLGDPDAIIHDKIMAIVAVYLDRTGRKLSFETRYMPSWVLNNEGPSYEEIMANPPEFDLDRLLENKPSS